MTTENCILVKGFFSYGFWPFFIFSALWAVINMSLWVLILHGQLALPTAFDPVSWHAHEALFGYLGAVMAGFLLTAVPNWTNRAPLTGLALIGLLTLWIAGRLAIITSAYLPPLTVAVIDILFLATLCGYVLREVVIGKNWRNLVLIAMVTLLIVGNAIFHWEAANNKYAASGYGLRMGLTAAILMISLIGGRIVPAFTRNWLINRGSAAIPAEFGLLDKLTLSFTSIALLFWCIVPTTQLTGYALLVSGLLQATRLSRWCGIKTRQEPLVWILHLGYAFVPIGMLAIGATILWSNVFSLASVQHLWMTGAIGVMTIAVMTRASLGHTGQELTSDRKTTTMYLLVIASVLTRLLGDTVPEHAMTILTLSAILWCFGFMLFFGRLLIDLNK